MPVSTDGRVEHLKRTQTANTLWPFGFVFGVQLGSLESAARTGLCRTFHVGTPKENGNQR